MNSEQGTHVVVVDHRETDRKAILACVSAPTYRVSEFETVEEVQKAIAADLPDLVIAEVRLPDASGYSLCRRIREDQRTSELPVMLLSEWSTELDRIIALESGADDFVARPFSQRELSSRIAAQLRQRSRRNASQEPSGLLLPHEPSSGIVNQAPRKIDISSYTSKLSNLTTREASILSALIESDGRPLSREKLIQVVWGSTGRPSERCVDSHVKSLRRKMSGAPGRIETVRGFGYRFSSRRA